MRGIKEKTTMIIGKTFLYVFCIIMGICGSVVSITLFNDGARAIGVIIGTVAVFFFCHPLLKWALYDLEKYDDRSMSALIFIGFIIMLKFIYYDIWLDKTLRIFHILILSFIVGLLLAFRLSAIKGWYNSLIIIRPLIILVVIAYLLVLFYIPSFFRVLFYRCDAQLANLCFCPYVIIQLLRYKKNILLEIRHLHFFNVDASTPYVLYLRSFDSDKKYKKHLKEIELFANNKKVYAIGNPKTIKQSLNSNYHIFYLPNTNWQGAVNNLSNKAEYIIINVGTTEGVLWEIASHQKWANKTIYCAESFEQLESFVQKALETDIIPTEFTKAVFSNTEYQTYHKVRLFDSFQYMKDPWLKSASSRNTIYFTVIDNNCVFVDSLSDFQKLFVKS